MHGVLFSVAIAVITRPPPGYASTFAAPFPLPSLSLPPPILPSAGAWDTGVYRNLFVESGLHTAAEVDARVNAIFAQLFCGDPDNERIYFASGNATGEEEAYVLDVGDEDVRSEGMSYGMMIAVQLDKQRGRLLVKDHGPSCLGCGQ